MKHFCVVLFILFFCRLAFAQTGQIATSPFYPEGGARPLGMGAAFVGLADDVNSLLYNPGGLAWVKGLTVSLRDSENITAGQAFPTGYGSSVGLAVVTTKLSLPSNLTTSTNSKLLLLSFGTKLNFLPQLYQDPNFQRIGVGINIKGLISETLRQQNQPDLSASGWDMDLGVIWKRTDWNTVGISLQNALPAKTLGMGEIKWDVGSAEGIPASLKIGTSAKIISDIDAPVYMEGKDLLLNGEIDFSRSNPALLRLGGEFGFNKTFFVRAGVMQQHQNGAVVSPINLGLGYRSSNWGVDLVSYHEATRNQNLAYLSFIYFPRGWVVVEKLEIEKPVVVMETPIEKISLEDNIVTYDDRIEVAGAVKPNVDIFINGLQVAVAADNNFRAVVPLEIGKNLILVEARYEEEKKSWKYKVLRKAKVEIAEEKAIQAALKKATTAAEKAELQKKESARAEEKGKVEELVTLGVIEVEPGKEFHLETGITRGELATWVVKAAGLPLPKVEEDPFPDVKRDDPLAPYIKLITQMNLMQPFADGTFRPTALVSKKEGERLFKALGIKS